MKVLLTGATGYIGSRLLQTLQASGNDVKVLVRNRSHELEGVEQRIGNLAIPESLKGVTKDVEVVMHLGGGMRPSDGDITMVNVTGTKHLMQDAVYNSVRRFVYLSAAVVYGDIAVSPANEETACNPLPGHTYALSKMEAEQHLFSLANDRTDLVVIRIPQVYSMKSPSISRFPQLAAMVDGKNMTHFVHREDVVRAIFMLANPVCAPGIYNVADDSPVAVQDAAAIVNKALRNDLRNDLRNEEMRFPQQQTTIPPMLRRVMEATLVLDTSKVKRLGFSPKYPSLKEGVYCET